MKDIVMWDGFQVLGLRSFLRSSSAAKPGKGGLRGSEAKDLCTWIRNAQVVRFAQDDNSNLCRESREGPRYT
jgi:hypothetical protein